MSSAPEPRTLGELDTAWGALFDVLVGFLDDVLAVQRDLVAAVVELQAEAAARDRPPADMARAEGTRRGTEGLRGQAHQSQLQAARLVEWASELTRRAERLQADAATLMRRRSPAIGEQMSRGPSSGERGPSR